MASTAEPLEVLEQVKGILGASASLLAFGSSGSQVSGLEKGAEPCPLKDNDLWVPLIPRKAFASQGGEGLGADRAT